MDQLKVLWLYRNFILTSIRTEYQSKFVRSKLGGAWMILNPLAMVAVYALVLSQILSAKLPGISHEYAYPVYLMAGILGWTFFMETLTKCMTLFVDNANLLKKVAFPKLTLVIIALGSALLNHLLLFIAVLGVFLLLGVMPNSAMLWMPLISLATILFAASIGLVLGVLNVFVRDIQQVVPIILQFSFWLTPIVYTINIIPEKYQFVMTYNPIYPLIQSYQQVIVYGHAPQLDLWGVPLIITAIMFILAVVLYKKAAPEMVDVL
jgi:lipopolysaccharide transport system permease protein